jgi:NADPH-dependent glutamate synthase beta subunit-like oxidoreductase
MNKKILIGSLLTLGVVVLAGCSTSNNISTTESSKNSQSETKKEIKKAKVEVASHKEKKSQYGASSIVGEVINNGDADASFVKITATYYDEKGEVVDTGFTYAGDTSSVALQPTKKAPFELGRIENIKYANYKLDVTWND